MDALKFFFDTCKYTPEKGCVFGSAGDYLVVFRRREDSVTTEERQVVNPNRAVYVSNSFDVVDLFHIVTFETSESAFSRSGNIYKKGETIKTTCFCGGDKQRGIEFFRSMEAAYDRIVLERGYSTRVAEYDDDGAEVSPPKIGLLEEYTKGVYRSKSVEPNTESADDKHLSLPTKTRGRSNSLIAKLPNTSLVNFGPRSPRGTLV